MPYQRGQLAPIYYLLHSQSNHSAQAEEISPFVLRLPKNGLMLADFSSLFILHLSKGYSPRISKIQPFLLWRTKTAIWIRRGANFFGLDSWQGSSNWLRSGRVNPTCRSGLYNRYGRRRSLRSLLDRRWWWRKNFTCQLSVPFLQRFSIWRTL